MAKRLVVIAKELNVGTSTIVEHLANKGFDIENKPTAKLDDDMYNELLKEFHKSIVVKEKADQLIIGTRKKEEEEVKTPAPIIIKPKPAKPVVEAKPEVVEPEPPKKEKESRPAPEPVAKAKSEKSENHGLKVVGKIDLDKKPAKKKTTKAKSEEPIKKKAKSTDRPKSESTTKPPVAEDKAIKAESVANEMIRAKTPQLKGLKILGKIDAEKLKKKETPQKSKTEPKEKRKRTRRKITASNLRGNNRRGATGARGRGRTDQPKEISQKQIDDKIKATMARLSGASSNKNKRQKLRRESRDRIREKQELQEQMENTDVIQLTEFVSVSELASLMDISVSDVITTCLNLGVIVSINQRLDAEIIEILATEFDRTIEFISAEEDPSLEEEDEDDPEDLEPRAPIVTVMGHVDHGKTSLLDYIREANVASGEAGGITQHVGAYEVRVGEDKKKITFLDTPGHEAFTAMRARGAKLTDIAIIIVAADDNIMPQTKEAISHSQAAGVPMVFAINKIDKDGADAERVKQELAGMNLLVEDWGGKYQSQDISAKTGQNIDQLLEKIILEAEVLELKANPDRYAVGTVIEAALDKGRGYVCKMLVQKGTLRVGDPMVAGEFSGKVKAMFNEKGKKIKKAGPSAPVLVLGLAGAPQAGELFKVTESEQEARQISQRRSQIAREQSNRASKRISLDEIGRRLALGSFKELNLIIKGDVDGSIEALADSLIKQSIESVQVNVIHKAVGQIIESDVLLASASDAIIIGFQVRPSLGARKVAEKEGVEIKLYSVIYEAIDEIKSAIEGLLEPTKEEKIHGQVEVRETYKISKIGTVAGCYVQDGKVTRNSLIRVVREGIVVFPNKEGQTGQISSLKRFKEDVKEVKFGFECGITIKNFNDIREGDVIEAYEIIEVKQKLS